MVNVVMVLLSLLVPLVHLAFARGPWTRRNLLRVFLIYAFVFDVGAVGFLFGFIPHVFFADATAELIGWPKGSGFQFEVGLHDGAWGILGFLCVFFGGGFWLATTIGWSFFLLGAAWGHVRDIVVAGNLAPYNLVPAFTDAFIPVYLIGLLYAYRRAGGLAGGLRPEAR
jgi:hypothetical protein